MSLTLCCCMAERANADDTNFVEAHLEKQNRNSDK